VAKVSAGSGRSDLSPLGYWLRERCQADGLSLRKAAAKAGVSHATISDIINGGRPSAATAVKLAKAFSGNGQHQKASLEDFLLTLCGYRSDRAEGRLREPLARLIDKLSEFSDAQLEIMEHFSDFITKSVDKT